MYLPLSPGTQTRMSSPEQIPSVGSPGRTSGSEDPVLAPPFCRDHQTGLTGVPFPFGSENAGGESSSASRSSLGGIVNEVNGTTRVLTGVNAPETGIPSEANSEEDAWAGEAVAAAFTADPGLPKLVLSTEKMTFLPGSVTRTPWQNPSTLSSKRSPRTSNPGTGGIPVPKVIEGLGGFNEVLGSTENDGS